MRITTRMAHSRAAVEVQESGKEGDLHGASVGPF